jgi:hypothetical protein
VRKDLPNKHIRDLLLSSILLFRLPLNITAIYFFLYVHTQWKTKVLHKTGGVGQLRAATGQSLEECADHALALQHDNSDVPCIREFLLLHFSSHSHTYDMDFFATKF